MFRFTPGSKSSISKFSFSAHVLSFFKKHHKALIAKCSGTQAASTDYSLRTEKFSWDRSEFDLPVHYFTSQSPKGWNACHSFPPVSTQWINFELRKCCTRCKDFSFEDRRLIWLGKQHWRSQKTGFESCADVVFCECESGELACAPQGRATEVGAHLLQNFYALKDTLPRCTSATLDCKSLDGGQPAIFSGHSRWDGCIYK